MAEPDDDHPSPFGPLQVELARMRKSNLTGAIDDVEKIIDLLTAAREQVAEGELLCPAAQTEAHLWSATDAHRISMAMTTLQNPVKARLDAVNQDLKEVTKAQKGFGKALDKVGSWDDSTEPSMLTQRRPCLIESSPWKPTPWPNIRHS